MNGTAAAYWIPACAGMTVIFVATTSDYPSRSQTPRIRASQAAIAQRVADPVVADFFRIAD
jgi:hypothetical protein